LPEEEGDWADTVLDAIAIVRSVSRTMSLVKAREQAREQMVGSTRGDKDQQSTFERYHAANAEQIGSERERTRQTTAAPNVVI
jgi:hypothetical protein